MNRRQLALILITLLLVSVVSFAQQTDTKYHGGSDDGHDRAVSAVTQFGVTTDDKYHGGSYDGHNRAVSAVVTLDPVDYGDAPDPYDGTPGFYPTLAANNGPSHFVSDDLRLGDLVDAETDGQQLLFANGDDLDGTDDEDGVEASQLGLTLGIVPSITVYLYNNTGLPATVAGWIDYDLNGVFEAEEKATAIAASGADSVVLVFPVVPLDAPVSSFARFRISTDSAAVAEPTGLAPDGEVEDYRVNMLPDAWLELLRQFWLDNFGELCDDPFSIYDRKLLAKAAADECFIAIGDDNNLYDPQYDNIPVSCSSGDLKVNQAYVWGLTKSDENLWFGTLANTHALVMGPLFSEFGLPLNPIQTASWVAEFGESFLAQSQGGPLPDVFGDWRPPRIFLFDLATEQLQEKTPPGVQLVNQTVGIRSAGTLGNVVFLAGPSFFPNRINLFAFNTQTGAYIDATALTGYNDIRKWVVHDGVLYAGVGTPTGGKILRWTGNEVDPFQFQEVGEIDAKAAYLIVHNNQLYVSTWGNDSGIWMSPVIPTGGLTDAHVGGWNKVWQVSDYESDPVTASVIGCGALASYGGYIYWGTMIVPGTPALAHFKTYGEPTDAAELIAGFMGTHRAITLFRGSNFDTGSPQVDLLYGLPALPKYTPDDPLNPKDGGEWDVVPNNMGASPLYGLSGFGNWFNTYTWSMAVLDGQLFVGTFDWSYVFVDFMDMIVQSLDLPIPNIEDLGGFFQSIPCFYGADLWRFPNANTQAIPESFTGVGNHTNYGIRNMVTSPDHNLYLGMANPMNLLTDPTDYLPEGGWELIELSPDVVIDITNPNGGDLYTGGESVEIEWTCVPSTIGTVTLKYSVDGGRTYPYTIVEGTANDGSYLWETPEITSNTVRIKGEVHGSLLAVDESDMNFTIDSEPPQVILYTPNGGEVWPSCSEQKITWYASDNFNLKATPIRLRLSTDGGANFSDYRITDPDEVNDGVYEWTIPCDIHTTMAKVKIKATDAAGNALCDESDDIFTIAPFSIEMTSPNGGEVMKGGSVVPIAWDTTTDLGTVTLKYSTSGGDSFVIIATDEANDGTFDWSVPEVDTDELLIKGEIHHEGAIQAEDTSDGPATIDNTLPEVTVIYPNGGEDIAAGGVVDITWTAADNTALKENPITILLSTDSGATFPTVLAEDEDNDGTYVWTVDAALETTTAKIKIGAEDQVGWTGTDQSDADFTVRTTTLAMSAPAGGEIWQGGTEHAIRWASNEPGGTITLKYSRDDGATYPHLIAEGEANDGEYLWTVPAINDTDLRVKIILNASTVEEVHSRSSFAIDSEGPNVYLLSLNDGLKLEAGMPVEIQWEAEDNIGLEENGVILEYTPDGGGNYTQIAANLATDQPYTWDIPEDLNTDNAKVRIHVTDRAGYEAMDHTDQAFSVEPLTVTLTSPAGGEVWQGTSEQTITWTSNFNVGIVNLYYSTDGGQTYPHVIAEDEVNDGTFGWTLPGITEENLRVRIELVNYTTAEHVSGIFAIDYSAPMVSVLYPNGEETIEATDELEIRWSASDHFALAENGVSLKYSTDGGETYPHLLGENETNDGTYTWSTPKDLFGDMFRIKISVKNSTGLTGSDESDANFLIVNPAPVVSEISDKILTNGDFLNIPLNDFVHDKNNRDIELTWTYSTTNTGLEVRIDNDVNVLRGFAEEGFSGKVEVLLTATDPHGATGEGTMLVTVESAATDVDDPIAALPTEFLLHQNYPNPFNPETTIQYDVPEPADVTVRVYNMNGKEVAELQNGRQQPGSYMVTWDALDQPSGTYLIRFQAGSTVMMKKCVLLK